LDIKAGKGPLSLVIEVPCGKARIVEDNARPYQACATQLARLAVLTLDDAPVEADAIRDATTAVLAEAVKSILSDRDLLMVGRLTRLAAAAHETVAAAESGDAARLRRETRRFEAFASALWSVQSGQR